MLPTKGYSTMDKLIFNILSGNYPLFESIPKQLRDSVQSSPLFIIDPNGKVRLAPYAIGITTNQLYTIEMQIRLTRETLSIDTAHIVGQAIKINETIQDQKIAAGITNHLSKMGLTPDAILNLVNNSFTRDPNDQNTLLKKTEKPLSSTITTPIKNNPTPPQKSDSIPEDQGFLDQFIEQN